MQFNALCSSFTLSLLLCMPGLWAQCNMAGTICTPDCTGIMLCTEEGANPIKLADCDLVNQGYCKEEDVNGTSEVSCSSPEPECASQDLREVACGSYGEFPHPIQCGRMILCGGENVEPIERIVCPSGQYVDPTKFPLDCSPTPAPGCPVDCSAEEVNIGPYCYACTDDNKIFAYTGCQKYSFSNCTA